MSVETIARRYGTALADVVLKTGETQSVSSELKGWEEMLASSADLRSAIANPSIAHLDKEKVLESLIAKSNPSKTTSPGRPAVLMLSAVNVTPSQSPMKYCAADPSAMPPGLRF